VEEKPAGTHIILSRSHQIWDSIMIDQTTIALSAHRLDKAKETLKQAELLLDNGGYDGSALGHKFL
jgi:hypothetical protein